MKLFVFCLIAVAISLASADVNKIKESVGEKKVGAFASDKSSDSKPKRDASHVTSVYHGPSYKYLPPSSISSSYDSYTGSASSSARYSGGHISNIGGAFGGGGNTNFGLSSGHHIVGATHGLSYAPATSYQTSGHHGQYNGHGSHQHFGGFKGGVASHNSGSYGHGGFSALPHSYASGHSYSSSGSAVGYKSHSAGLGSGYEYSKGTSGSFSSPASSGFGSVHGGHHGDHVHNGGQEHVYVISSGTSGFGNSHDGAVSVGKHGIHEIPTGSYLPPVQQHPLPSSSYGVPFTTIGDSYNTKLHIQVSSSAEHGPAYAAGHKGLGHFSFTSNKPQVLHTSITGSSYPSNKLQGLHTSITGSGFTSNKPQVLHTSITGSSFNQPSYSKAPFKPSTFLGAKYEISAPNEAPGQQYLPPANVENDSTGYDYPIPSGSGSVNFQDSSYQHNVDVQTALHEPDSVYLPPNNNEGSFNELPSAPSASYLPPSNTYGVPYSQ